MKLYKQLGFSKHPFSTFSAEEEKDFLDNIYIKPLFYDTLVSDLENGNSRFILGARGVGKTALINQMKNELNIKNFLTVIIDDFNAVPNKNNKSEILELILEKIVTKFSIFLIKNKDDLKKLTKQDKEVLAVLVKKHFKTLSKKEFEDIFNKLNLFKKRNLLRKIVNFLIKPGNTAINLSVDIASETIRKSLGLPDLNDNNHQNKEYFSKFRLEKPKQIKEKEKYAEDVLKKSLNELCLMIKKTSLSGTVIFFDKIDENPKLGSNVQLTIDFLVSTLSDTTILMNENFSLAFSLWDILKSDLQSRGVRFDKIKPVDITWKHENLMQILNKRVSYFSDGDKNINSIITNEENLENIIELSNNSPRYLLRQFSFIYDEQTVINLDSNILSQRAIEKGQLTYAYSFEYYAVYPMKRGSSSDILIQVNKLLKIGKSEIVSKDFVDVFKVGSNAANNYIKIMQGFNLVKTLPVMGPGGAKKYKIIDPIVKHLIKREIKELKK